jgi:FkbM family methyltransferase
MPIIREARIDRRNPESCYLLKYRKDVTSQCGEDGIIPKIFEIIGSGSKWCVEFGAWDGKHFSNTYNLIANDDWTGVLIEASEDKFVELQKTYEGNTRAICVCGVVQPRQGKDSLDDHLSKTEIPKQFDLLSIDIDGNDFYVWESLTNYRPRVIIIEFNPTIPNDIVFIQDLDMSVNHSSSLLALVELGKSKGYELVCVSRWNAIFVVTEEFPKFNIANNSVDDLHFPPREGKYFQGFDGTLFHVGLLELGWAGKGRKFAPDELQIMDSKDRHWGGALPAEIAMGTTEQASVKPQAAPASDTGGVLPDSAPAPATAAKPEDKVTQLHALKQLAIYGIYPKSILHIGAHWGQEAPFYNSRGVERVLFVEAIPSIFERLKKNISRFPGFDGVLAVCSDVTGATVEFNVSSNDGGSSSMLELGNHANLYPDISYVETLSLETITADDLVAQHSDSPEFDLVVLDTQGAELHVLRGATDVLRNAKALWIEVSEEPLYEGGCTFEEVTAYVRQFGFRLRSVLINKQGWGDALYVSETAIKAEPA